MERSQRRRPWWQWVLAGLLCLVVLSAIFGGGDDQPAGDRGDGTATVPFGASAAPPEPEPVEPARTIADARAAADAGRYEEAVEIATMLGGGATGAVRRRIANRIARRTLAAVAAGDTSRARFLLGQARRYPATARSRRARASYRAARERVRLRRVAAQARRRQAERRAAAERAAAERPADCDPNYAGACLDPGSPDYDCEGGSGNGPDYTGTVQVVGDDHFDLDRDGDGTGCDA
jgi:hypothetical protein